MKARSINIEGQLAKLFPSFARNLNFTREQQRELVLSGLESEHRRCLSGHWSYCLNRHMALVELHKALQA